MQPQARGKVGCEPPITVPGNSRYKETERKMKEMKDSGIMRRVDSLGRFVLPKELRRQLQIECNDYLQIYTEGEKIIIQKAQCCCALCSRTDDLIDFNDKKVCKSCVSLIKDYL